MKKATPKTKPTTPPPTKKEQQGKNVKTSFDEVMTRLVRVKPMPKDK